MQTGPAEVDTINVIIGDGASAITTGVAAALRVDFRARVTGYFLQEFDGTSGSITVSVQRAVGGASPIWTVISPSTPVGISSAALLRRRDRLDLAGHLHRPRRLPAFPGASASTITRVHVALRIRRLEPCDA